ncbi:hypothetical protein [Clostridium weizhouense]|uniref:Carboxypeptidase regulatory-like domain-containing protein n=1 Tax=Clostridium weizhouense TaxID=2859781 RepID=A0ABS7ALE3_9CLOT|nr:hypothetical protein [Clostridium weizhouense]MBW6409478.1 hypothetical protein [Clostridium weizhouense]
MKKINCYNCYKGVLIRGYVYNEDMSPVKNAIVILEIVLSEDKRKLINLKLENRGNIYCMDTTTNEFGEFCFKIFDINHYYKIKIFENDKIDNTNKQKVFIEI